MKCRQRRSKPHRKYRKRTQRGCFPNRFDFGYSGRDIVNQVGKIAPSVIKNPTKETNDVAQRRTNQIISQRGKEVERVFPKFLRGAIEDETPFRLLGNFGKQQLNKLKTKILR